MSNTDYSGTTLATQKSAQTQFAGFVAATANAAVTPGLIRMGGRADSGVGILTATGGVVAGATSFGEPLPAAATTNNTSYSLSRAILAAAAAKNGN